MESLYKKVRAPYLIIAVFTLLTTLILWLPFIFKLPNVGNIKLNGADFKRVEANWDGPLYIIVAKTFYDPTHPIFTEPPLGLQANYYPAHLPLYPLTIKLLSSFFSYPKAMLSSTIISSILLFCLFYYFVNKHKLSNHPLLLTSIFMLWPRLLVARSVGSPEPLFLLLIMTSVFLFAKKRYLFSSILGGLAVMTKTPGILLFPTYGAYFVYDYLKNKMFDMSRLSIMLIPLSLFGVFSLYGIQLNDFFAFYHTGGVVPMSGLYSAFNAGAKWVGTAWLEDIVFLFLFMATATIFAISSAFGEKKIEFLQVIAFFMVIFLLPLTFVEHRDISRYGLPLIPFVLIIFEKFLTDRRFYIAVLFVLPAIYLYAINFILQNTSPITEWLPFL